MSSNQVSLIPSWRRDVLFAEIRKKINEVDAIDRALEGFSEGMVVDEALEEITDLLAAEIQTAVCRSKRRQRLNGVAAG